MKKYKVRDFFGIPSIFLAILTLVISATILFIPLYQFTLIIHDIPQQVGMPFETIMDNYYVLIEYLHSPFISELNFPDFSSSESGLFHFYEVKRLFFLNYGVLFVSGTGSIVYLRKLFKNNRFYVLTKPFQIAKWVPLILLIFLAVSFDTMFVIFHQLLFNNNAWVFNPQMDPIINVLPQQFFMYCFIFAFILLQGLLVFGSKYSKKMAFK